MFLARVIGSVVSTVEHAALHGRKLLIVERIDPEGRPLGKTLLAIDSVDAGEGDTVLVVDEGGSAAMVTGLEEAPIRTVIVGVVDSVDLEE
ncbi:MAG: EutN/CcmL family microcompartment protein [Candidatus Eisenbacteria bacterium]